MHEFPQTVLGVEYYDLFVFSLRSKCFRRAFRRFEAFFVFERAKIGASEKKDAPSIRVALAPIFAPPKTENASSGRKNLRKRLLRRLICILTHTLVRSLGLVGHLS